MRKVLLQLFSILSISLVISCEKEDEQFPPVTSTEKNVILLPDGGNLITKAIDINNTVLTYDILQIKRDTKSAGELNKTQIVKIAKSNSILSDFSGAEVKELMTDYYQSHPDNPFDGQFWTVTFQPGETTKYLKINLKAIDLLSLGRVGLGFQIAEAKNAQISDSKNQVAVEISAKNQYDGVYRLKGVHNRPGLDLPYDEEVYMISSGPNSVYMFWPALGLPGHPLNGGTTYYGDFTSNFYFDPATNLITSWDWTPYATTLPVAMGPATDSRYNPATKTIYAQFYYNNNPTQRGFSDTLTYLHPR
jgi:hypothetical protein